MKFWFRDTEQFERPSDYFLEKRWRMSGVYGLILLLSLGSAFIVQFDLIQVFTKAPQALTRFTQLYMPPDFSEPFKLMEAIWMTVLLSIAAGTLGSLIAYLAAIGMSKQTGKSVIARGVLRLVTTFIRNVPATIWAIILLMAFWFGEFLALLVMTLGTYGFNARIYSDMIDETNPHSVEALEASGASYWQVITQAVFPETLPSAISWTLYAIELNIRSATIIGMLAGGGIGHVIGIFKHYRQFEKLSAAVIVIVVMILAFDQLSMTIRKRILT